MFTDEALPLVLRPIDSPYPGAPHAVELGAMVNGQFECLDQAGGDYIYNDAIAMFGEPGARAGRWVSVPRSVFAFANESDLVLFVLKWRGSEARTSWHFG